jgi:L-ascorbate metabolism protein UlaG (beta-lactamase superfamily)
MNPVPSDPPAEGTLEILFIGNATTLIRFGELKLLTDPNFLHRGDYAHLGYGILTRRLLEPAVSVEELPRDLDAVILSHLHGDHWDRTARHGLNRSVPVLTTPHAARSLRYAQGFDRSIGLRTWRNQTLVRGESQVTVTALPGQHGPGLARYLLPPVMGSLLEFGPRQGPVRLRLYISGDTLLFDGIDEIARRCPDIGLAVLHLGGTTLPGGLVVSMDGAQGAELMRRLDPRRALPVHYEDYEAMKSPLADFLAEAERRGLGDRIVRCERGRRAVVGVQGGVGVA